MIPPPTSSFFRVRHFKALVEDDHELSDLIFENHEFGWCVTDGRREGGRIDQSSG